MNIRWIDFDRLEVYEAGALLVTLLAYPEESEETHSEVHASLCGYALRAKCVMEPDWAIPSQPMKPIYALRRQDENDRFLRTLERRVRDRVVAGRMAIGFLKEALTGEVPPGIKRVSINELAQLVLNDVGYTEPENDQKNLASPSDRHRAIRARSEVTNCSEHSGPNANSPNDPASGANANPTRSLGASSLIG